MYVAGLVVYCRHQRSRCSYQIQVQSATFAVKNKCDRSEEIQTVSWPEIQEASVELYLVQDPSISLNPPIPRCRPLVAVLDESKPRQLGLHTENGSNSLLLPSHLFSPVFEPLAVPSDAIVLPLGPIDQQARCR